MLKAKITNTRQDPVLTTPPIYQEFAFEQLTVDNTANGVSLTAATWAPKGSAAAVQAQCRLETAEIRFRTDPGSVSVSTTVGTLLETGELLTLDGFDALTNFRAIRTGTTSGVLNVRYLRVANA